MAEKLSDALATLAVKTKSVEDKIEEAKTATKERLDAKIAEAKATVETKKKDFIAKAEAIKVKESGIKEQISQKIDHLHVEAKLKKEAIHKKIEARKHNFRVDEAEDNYFEAVNYADNCIDWAIIALSDVEEATLEAFKAKLELDNLKDNA